MMHQKIAHRKECHNRERKEKTLDMENKQQNGRCKILVNMLNVPRLKTSTKLAIGRIVSQKKGSNYMLCTRYAL